MKLHPKVTSWSRRGKRPEGTADKTIDFDDIVVHETAAQFETEEIMESCNFEISFKSDGTNELNQASLDIQDTKGNRSQVTKTKLHKKFGDAKKSKKGSSGHMNLIAVDEKEKVVETKHRSKNSNSVPKSKNSNIQLAKKRSNVSHLSKRTASQLTKSLSNLSHLLVKNNKIHTPQNKSDISHLIATDKLDKRLTSHEKASRSEKLVKYTISLDSIGGISCTNLTGKCNSSRDHDNPSVVISYFKKSTENGKTEKFDIVSLPLKKSYSVNKTKAICHAKFEDEDDMGQKQKFSVLVGMKHNGRKKSGFDAKDFYLQVSLILGNEVIKLGNAILPLNGDETGVKKSIPLGNIKLVTKQQSNKKNKAPVSQVSKIITEGLEAVSFSCDPKRKYALEGSHLLISNVRSELKDDRNKLTSMVIFPSLVETVSNLSEGDFRTSYSKKKVNDTQKNEQEGPPEDPSTTDFSAAMADLLNLETNSTNDSPGQDHSNDDSTVVPDMSSVTENKDSNKVIDRAFQIMTASSEESVASSTVKEKGPIERAFDTINAVSSDEISTSVGSNDRSIYTSSQGSTTLIASQYSTSYIGSAYSTEHTFFTDDFSANGSSHYDSSHYDSSQHDRSYCIF